MQWQLLIQIFMENAPVQLGICAKDDVSKRPDFELRTNELFTVITVEYRLDGVLFILHNL